MGDKSKIEWTDATWNPVTGCTKVSEGCRNCYIARTLPRHGQDPWEVKLHPERLEIPLHWRSPRRIFISLTDLFHDDISDDFIERVWATMCCADWHTFQILTKRPERMHRFLQEEDHWDRIGRLVVERSPFAAKRGLDRRKNGSLIFRHVWLGVSVEDQQTADQRIPLLLQTTAAVRFVSYEPALGMIDFHRVPRCSKGMNGFPDPVGAFAEYQPDGAKLRDGVDWLIVGGESGPGARPMCPDWARSARDQCQAAGVPFFFKQWGEWLPNERSKQIVGCHGRTWQVTEGNKTVVMVRVGKKNAGRLLDGREWNEYPRVVAP